MRQGDNTGFIDQLEEFYTQEYHDNIDNLIAEFPEERKSLYIDWADLNDFNDRLAREMIKNPVQMQEYAQEALRQFDTSTEKDLGQSHIRIQGALDSINAGEIRADHRGQLIAVPGTIRSVSAPVSFPTEAAFECQRCGTITRIPQSFATGDLSLAEPHECRGCERQGPFRLEQSKSKIVDHQLLRLESFFTESTRESPASLILLAEDDIVNSVQPGDTVRANGVLNLVDPSEGAQLDATIVDKYLNVSSFTKVETEDLISFTDEDENEIIQLAQSDDLYDRFVESIAPHVHGLEDLKLSVVLQLFGGVDKVLPDDTTISGTIHIAAIADPGMFESEIVKYAARISPRSVRVDGTDTTQAGLTTAAYKTSNGPKNWELDAGALVLADGGIASLTQIGKLSSEALSGLENVMREHEVKASKGTATQVLPANTSILASARPKYGRFDEYEPIGGQVNLNPSIVSQFDLIFTQVDNPDDNHDAEVAEQILKTSYAGEVQRQKENDSAATHSTEEAEDALEDIIPEIDPKLVEKYIAYARQNCFPKLSQDAKTAIQEFYVETRTTGTGEDNPIPVTARKLEAMVKLAEASARVRLSDTIEEEDANRVIDLVRSSLENLGVDPDTEDLDAEVVETGTSKRQRDRIKNIRGIISDLEEKHDSGAPVDEVIERAEQVGLEASKAEHEIMKLKQQGEIYEIRTDHLSIT